MLLTFAHLTKDFIFTVWQPQFHAKCFFIFGHLSILFTAGKWRT